MKENEQWNKQTNDGLLDFLKIELEIRVFLNWQYTLILPWHTTYKKFP